MHVFSFCSKIVLWCHILSCTGWLFIYITCQVQGAAIRIVLWSGGVWSASGSCCAVFLRVDRAHREHNANLPEVAWGDHCSTGGIMSAEWGPGYDPPGWIARAQTIVWPGWLCWLYSVFMFHLSAISDYFWCDRCIIYTYSRLLFAFHS